MWNRSDLPLHDARLALHETGEGAPLLFLHGGPGDDSLSLRSLCERLADRFRCVLFDQRGSGQSELLVPASAGSLAPARFLEDIETVREHLGLERVDVVGHSWGAALGLLYAVTHPERVRKLALLGMAPLNPEQGAVTTANLLHGMSAPDRARMEELRFVRHDSSASGDDEAARRAHDGIVEVIARRWFVKDGARGEFLASYLGKARYNAVVSQHAWPLFMQEFRSLDRLREARAQVFVQYGYQDYCPIEQAFLLREKVPSARLSFVNEAGHFPWLDQPERSLAPLREFLTAPIP